MPEIKSDARHRRLMEQYLKKLDEMGYENIEIEKPYNYYGQRGFIDVFYSYEGSNESTVFIVEIKPDLENLGEALRQLIGAKSVILNHGINPIIYNAKVLLSLVTELDEKNFNILYNSKNILINCPVFLEFYCTKTKKFIGFWTDIEKKHNEKNYYINQLSWQSSMCFKGLTIDDLYKAHKRFPRFFEFLQKEVWG